MQPSLSQRIKIIMDALNVRAADVTRRSGLSSNTLSRMLSGKNEMGFGIVQSFYLAYPEINPAYLLAGIGDPLLDKNGSEKPPKVDKINAMEREIELLNELLKAYRKIDDLKPVGINAKG